MRPDVGVEATARTVRPAITRRLLAARNGLAHFASDG
jgi:hypothetical protein